MSSKALNQFITTTTKKIVKEFKPEKIILFGSQAWGRPGPGSDIDLLIIKDTQRSTRQVASEIDGSLWGRAFPIDIIVSTPQRIERNLQRGDLFFTSILQKGKVLYERKHPVRERMARES